jgi:hypothetical protein
VEGDVVQRCLLQDEAAGVGVGVRGMSGSAGAPAGVFRCRTRSWAKSVEKTSGAPSMGRTTEGLRRQATWLASAGRSGGGTAVCTEGSAMTSTDLGLWNDGGVLRRRFMASACGKLMAGMYWYWAVCRLP